MRLLEKHGRPHVVIGQVNQNLPYFGNDAEVAPDRFDFVVDHARYTTALFSTPKMPVTAADYAIGLYTSRSEEHTSELQSLMRISYAVFCLKKKKNKKKTTSPHTNPYTH